jgi:hypothetical protein
LQASHLSVRTNVGIFFGHPLINDFRVLRRTIWTNLDAMGFARTEAATQASAQVVVVGRANQTRAIANQRALLRGLRSSFHGVDFRLFDEDATAFDHCDQFRRADLIISPHGATLSNLLCSREGTSVVELLCPIWKPPSRDRPQYNLVFMHLAWALGLSYYGVHVPGASYAGDLHVDYQHIGKVVASIARRGWIRRMTPLSPYTSVPDR